MRKRNLTKLGLAVGALALCWLLESTGVINVGGASGRDVGQSAVVHRGTETTARQATPSSGRKTVAQQSAAPSADDGIVKDGEYFDKKSVAAYIRKFKGKLPKNYITKARARSLGWQGGPVEPFAPGKAIGGDWFGNYEHRLPDGTYRECDIDTRGKPRGVKRLIYTPHGQKIYYTGDHYETFEEVVAQ